MTFLRNLGEKRTVQSGDAVLKMLPEIPLLLSQNHDKIAPLVNDASQLHPAEDSNARSRSGGFFAFPAFREFSRSLKPVWVLATVMLTVMGAGFLRFTGPSLDGSMQFPKIGAVAICVLFIGAICSALWMVYRFSKANEVVETQKAEIVALEENLQGLKEERKKVSEFVASLQNDILRLQTMKANHVSHADSSAAQVDGFLTPSLDLMVKQPVLVNHVMLEYYSLKCTFRGSGPVLDAGVVYVLKGRNISGDILTELKFPIVGDNFALLRELDPRYYDLSKDPGKNKKKLPQLRSEDGKCKILALKFENPGVGPYKDFHIELQYTWPGTFNRHKDYWFIDNTCFEGDTEKLVFELDVTVMEPGVTVSAYSVDRDSHTERGLGLADETAPGVYRYSPPHPEKNAFYVLLVEKA